MNAENEKNTKTVEKYVNSMAAKAERFMEGMECGTHLYTKKDGDGLLNYQYILKHSTGRVEQYVKLGTNLMEPPVTTTSPPPDRPNSNEVMLFTQRNAQEPQEEEVEEEEEDEKTVLLATVSEENNDKAKEGIELDSREEYENAVADTRHDEATKYEERWWSTGKCVHCGDINLCHIYKFGPYCINVANATRVNSSQQERKKLVVAFCDAYQYASQYAKFIKDPYDHQQIQEDDLENLPHCTYRLMDNWLRQIKEANRARAERRTSPNNKRANDKENHDGKHNKKQRTMK